MGIGLVMMVGSCGVELLVRRGMVVVVVLVVVVVVVGGAMCVYVYRSRSGVVCVLVIRGRWSFFFVWSDLWGVRLWVE